MLKIENVDVWGFKHAIRGMRNPLNSWNKSDSGYGIDGEDEDTFVIGKKDLQLMQGLYKAGSEHRKYLRQIFISMDITAPLYWWKEMDQYRINVTTNSCSTMHTIHKKEFELDDFSTDKMNTDAEGILLNVIEFLNRQRDIYLNGIHGQMIGSKEFWWNIIQLLPSSYNQKRTVTMNYENVVNIIHQRIGHKLDEWNVFVGELKNLPYVKEIMGDVETE